MISDPWEIAEAERQAARERADIRRGIVRESIKRASPVGMYNAAVRQFCRIAKDADPRPGKMTPEQESAQCAVVNAYLVLTEPWTVARHRLPADNAS